MEQPSSPEELGKEKMKSQKIAKNKYIYQKELEAEGRDTEDPPWLEVQGRTQVPARMAGTSTSSSTADMHRSKYKA